MAVQQVSVDRLQPGVFIEIGLPWHRHPFFFNRFKIQDEAQIAVLREIGLEEVAFDPDKSDAQPLPTPTDAPPQVVHKASPMAAEKRRRIERLKVRRERYAKCDKAFRKQVSSARSVMNDLRARPQQAMAQATLLVDDMVDVISSAGELMVHLMNDKTAHDSVYFHSLNVAVLSMLLGEQLQLDKKTLQVIGLGALFHDVGKERVPPSVLHKRGPWTKAEREFVEQHPLYGVEIAEKIKSFPREALAVIEQHHEALDGSGFPRKLRKDEILLATKVVQVANVYDNHCNPHDQRTAKTPHQAMSFMLAYQRDQLDATLVQLFIKALGIYPPGSIVRLSNDMVGIVIAVDHRDLLNPSVLVYDPDVPKAEALVIDLVSEKDLSVIADLRPAELPAGVVNYLSPSMRMSYYFDASGPSAKRRPGG